MRRLLTVLAAFAFMVLFLESVVAAVRWWHGEALAWPERVLALLLPVLIAVWARYFSVFGCGAGRCLPNRGRDDT